MDYLCILFRHENKILDYSAPPIFFIEWKFKGSVHHFGKIGRCFDGHLSSMVLVFISPRCLETVGLTKNLAQNSICLFEPRILDFFLTRLLHHDSVFCPNGCVYDRTKGPVELCVTLTIKNNINKYQLLD